MSAAALRSDATGTGSDPLASIRSRGVLALSVSAQDGVTRRVGVREEGALRMRFPNEASDRLTAVTVNVAGGMAGGDVYDCAFATGAGSNLVVTSAAAEKVYRALGAPTRSDLKLAAASGSLLAYVPQETILFDSARFVRRCEIDIAVDARLLLADIVILGRAAMGEQVRSLLWRDAWRMRRNGKLIWADATRVEGDATALLAAPAAGGGAHAFGLMLYAAPDAAARLEDVREALHCAPGCEAAATMFDELIVVRFAAHAGHFLRAAMMTAFDALPGCAAPRSWST